MEIYLALAALLLAAVSFWNARVAMERVRRLETITGSEIEGETYANQGLDKKA